MLLFSPNILQALLTNGELSHQYNMKKYLEKTQTQKILLIGKLKRILKNNLILNHLMFLIL